MFKKIIYIICFLFFLSCNKTNYAKGTHNQITIISSKADKTYAYDSISDFFSKTVNTPYDEPVYELKWVDPYDEKGYLDYKNLFFLSLESPHDSTVDLINLKFKEKHKNDIFLIDDLYAENQVALIFNVEDSSDMKFKLNYYKEWILDVYNNNIDKNIYKNLFYSGYNTEIEKEINEKFDIDALIQSDYKIIKNDSIDNNFLWIGRGYPYRWVTFIKTSLDIEKDLWVEYKRVVNEYMNNVHIVDYYNNISYDGDIVVKFEGLYEEDFSDTGGPFFSKLYRLNNNEILFISGYVNNPGKSKYLLLKELEVLIDNFKL